MVLEVEVEEGGDDLERSFMVNDLLIGDLGEGEGEGDFLCRFAEGRAIPKCGGGDGEEDGDGDEEAEADEEEGVRLKLGDCIKDLIKWTELEDAERGVNGVCPFEVGVVAPEGTGVCVSTTV